MLIFVVDFLVRSIRSHGIASTKSSSFPVARIRRNHATTTRLRAAALEHEPLKQGLETRRAVAHDRPRLARCLLTAGLLLLTSHLSLPLRRLLRAGLDAEFVGEEREDIGLVSDLLI